MRPTNPFVELRKEDIEQSISDRFEQQARRYPDRLAVKTKRQRLTYDALNRISNRTAHAVLARSDQRNEPVVLLFRQAAPLIAASIGALKAGKAYVSLDFSLPHAKAKQILEDVQPRLIITDSDHRSLAHELGRDPSEILNLGDIEGTLPDENPGLSLSPDQIAYINYTSGSTGEPKGVVWNHRNELFGIRVKTNELHISPEDRVSLVRSNNVGATRDMFLALLNGAALLPFDLREDGLADLGNWLITEDITVFTCVATIFRHSVHSLDRNKKFSSVRLIHIGGEPLFKSDVDLYKKHFSDECIFVNRYSISETQPVSYHFINKQTEIKGERVPVGYPLEGNEILLLDDNGNQIDVNQIGEIAVKSPYLALGYWRQPELTRAKFLPDPNGGSTRIYLTGDLGCRLPDGCLIYMGRKDFQAKIRGHRVEIPEVETALLDIPAIKQAVVVPWGDAGGAKRLVAYVVFQPGQARTVGQLRGFLKAKLPDYMLPTSIMTLDTLPLTMSGKVDRRALPIPGRARPGLDIPVTAPRNPVESAVARIWSGALNMDEVGIHDNFFDLGGDSLLASGIIANVRKKFQVIFPLGDFFEAPTVAGVAERIEKSELDDRRSKVPRLTPVRRERGRPLSFAQEQLWHLSRLLPGTDFFNLSSACVINGALNIAILKKSLKELIKRHQSLRTVFGCANEQPVQIVGQVFDMDVSPVDLRHSPAAHKQKKMTQLARSEASRPFDLAKGPLIRIKLYDISEDEHVLLVTMHHIISDRWSIRVFWNELAIIYEALSKRRQPLMPEIRFQFADFVCWERRALDSRFMKVRLDYWLKQLAAPLPRLVFSRRSGKKKALSFRTAQLPIDLNKNVFAALKNFSRTERSTPFTVLLAALNITLHVWTGQNDVSVGTLVANRDHPEAERVIGHFINTVILRCRVYRSFTLREFLTQVRDTTLAAQAHQHLPFEYLVRSLEENRKISRTSLFQVMFIYHNIELQTLEPTSSIFTPADKVWSRADNGMTLTTCELILFLKETSNGLVGSLIFKRDMFDSKKASGLLRRFFRILECIMEKPESTIGGVCANARELNH
jgi:amino acid adenylation domain-containing protein